MCRDRRRDYDGVDIHRIDERPSIRRAPQAGITAFRLRHARRVAVAHGYHLASIEIGKIPNEIRPPVAVADHADPNGGCARHRAD
jgi:hypothetical protein